MKADSVGEGGGGADVSTAASTVGTSTGVDAGVMETATAPSGSVGGG